MLPLSANWARCGVGVEGYSSEGQSLVIARQLKALGADVRYYGMDEPLYFGHVFDKKNACHSSIPDLANDVGNKVRMVQSVFPSARRRCQPVGLNMTVKHPDPNSGSDVLSATGRSWRFSVDMQGPACAADRSDSGGAAYETLQIIDIGGNALALNGLPGTSIFDKNRRQEPHATVFQTCSASARLLPETDPDTLTRSSTNTLPGGFAALTVASAIPDR
jgi:hypothetical protein